MTYFPVGQTATITQINFSRGHLSSRQDFLFFCMCAQDKLCASTDLGIKV
jgi:hypothetical protein